MSEKKYELIPSDKEGLFRIKAIKSFSNVTKGDLGGFVESEHNLSHFDTCWISHDAIVSGYARVYDSAQVSGYALVSGSARVYDSAIVSGYARVYDNALVSGRAQVSDRAVISDHAHVSGVAIVFDNARVFGFANIYSGNIQSTNDYMTIGPIGSRDDFTTFFKDKDKIMVSCGCYKGTIQEFETRVKKTHKDNNVFKKQYLNAIIYVKSIME